MQPSDLAPWAIRRLLVPVDFSAPCREVLARSLVLGSALDADLDLVHVCPGGDAADPAEIWFRDGELTEMDRPALRDPLVHDMRTLLAGAPLEQRARVRARILRGEVKAALLELAHDFDLIVMGTNARRGLEHVLLGSVAEHMLREAPCPVLTTRAFWTRPFPRALTMQLRDGVPVLLRPIVPQDKEPLRRSLGQLSEQSRFRRFMAPIRDFTPQQLTRLTEIDYHDHMAWGAVLLDEPESLVGVARYVRLADEPGVAEAAVAVVDAFQARGLGTLLLGALTRSAANSGVEAFRAYVLEENAPMRGILEECGAQTGAFDEGCLQFELPVPKEFKSVPHTPMGQVFKLVARQMATPPAVGFLHREPVKLIAEALGRLFK